MSSKKEKKINKYKTFATSPSAMRKLPKVFYLRDLDLPISCHKTMSTLTNLLSG